MKKILVTLLVLAIAAPALATVNFSASDIGSGQLRIAYSCDAAEAPRGVALKITLSGGATCDPATGVLSTDPNFNTYIDYAWSAGSGYTVGSGQPLAIDGARGPLASAASTFVVCMGVLDPDGNQAGGQISTANLITLQLAGTGSTNVTIDGDTYRGPLSGVVGSVLTSNLPLGISPLITVSFAPPESVSTPTVAAPYCGVFVGQSLRFTASGSTCTLHPTDPVQYRFDWGDASPISAWGAAVQAHSYSPAGASYTVLAQARCSVNTAIESAWSAGLGITVGSECQKYNLTKRIDGLTDNSLNVTDLAKLIGYVNANRYNPSVFAVLTSQTTQYDPCYNFDAVATINVNDVSTLIGYVNAGRLNPNVFTRICP